MNRSAIRGEMRSRTSFGWAEENGARGPNKAAKRMADPGTQAESPAAHGAEEKRPLEARTPQRV